MGEVRTDERSLNTPSSEVRNDRAGNGPTPEIRDDRDPNEASPEVRPRDSVEEFVGRLSTLNATIDEINAVRAHWDEPWDDEEWSKERLLRMSDQELADLIAAGRQEYRSSTLTEDEEAAQNHRAAVAGYTDEAEHMVTSGTVEAVLEWVGDDDARAEAALLAEQTVPDHTPRVTLVAALEKLAAGE